MSTFGGQQSNDTAAATRDVTVMEIASGYCNDGIRFYIPGVNCIDCGRFVGRDGYIGYGTREMSSTIAYVEGECARCIKAKAVIS